jgi:hypothetical protein
MSVSFFTTTARSRFRVLDFVANIKDAKAIQSILKTLYEPSLFVKLFGFLTRGPSKPSHAQAGGNANQVLTVSHINFQTRQDVIAARPTATAMSRVASNQSKV